MYLTHDQVEAMTLADQIVVLNQSKIQQIAAPQEIYAQPVNQMVAVFSGNPPMDILQATYDGNAFQVDRQSIPCPEREILVRTMLLTENRGKSEILSIQMSPTSRPQVGDRLPVQLDLNHLCIFEPTTGKNLIYGGVSSIKRLGEQPCYYCLRILEMSNLGHELSLDWILMDEFALGNGDRGFCTA